MKFTPFFTILNQLRIYHWQTKSYAQHKALGKACENLDELFDSFVETYLGKYGSDIKNIEYTVRSESYKFNNAAELSARLSELFEKFLEVINSMLAEEDTDLKNIRDDILGEFNHLKYLLTLE